MAPHRYWRLYINAVHDGASVTATREIDLRETSGGPDVATGGTASASSANYPPANAFDGGTGNLWQSSGAPPQWIAYDFGSGVTKDITEYVWHSTPTAGQQPSSLQLEWSDDGAAWTLAFAHTSVSAWSADEVRTFTAPVAAAEPIKVRKVHGLAVVGPSPVSVAARKVHGLAVVGPSPVSVAARKIHGYAVLHDAAVAPVPVEAVAGAASNTLDAATSNASGNHSETQPEVTGTGTHTLASLTSDGTGTAIPPAVTGTAQTPLSSLTSDATGTIGYPPITGASAAFLGNLEGHAEGVHIQPVIGLGAAFLGNLEGHAEGVHIQPVIGLGAGLLEGIPTMAATGEHAPPQGVVTWPPPRVRKVYMHATVRR